jgi:hypothetical protein
MEFARRNGAAVQTAFFNLSFKKNFSEASLPRYCIIKFKFY